MDAFLYLADKWTFMVFGVLIVTWAVYLAVREMNK